MARRPRPAEPVSLSRRRGIRCGQLAAVACVAMGLGGCALFEMPEWARQPPEAAPQARPEAPLPIDSRRFVLVPGEDVVGEIQIIHSRHADTFVDIARAYDLGYDELVAANPGVDPWLPGEGTRIVLPTQFILPGAPREGLVLNTAAKRLYWFPPRQPGRPREVVTHPVGIGREGWSTPLGTARVIAKAKDPVWTVPASIRREHAAAGDPLPARVPAGPDNPLGHRALRLSLPSYLIHGTNRPAGIGMRVSHGCIQLFPEDIESLYEAVPVGAPVRIVDEPLAWGWRGGNLYFEAHPPLEEDARDLDRLAVSGLDRQLRRGETVDVQPDRRLVGDTLAEARGLPVPVLQPAASAASVIARAAVVRNIVVHAEERPPVAGPAPDPVAADARDPAR